MFVIGVDDQQHVESFYKIFVLNVRLARDGEHHAKIVFAIRKIVVRINERLPERFFVTVGGNRWEFSDQTMNADFDVVWIHRVQGVLIKR